MNWHNKHNVIYLKQKIYFYFQINLNIMIYQNIAYIVLEFISISMAKKRVKKKRLKLYLMLTVQLAVSINLWLAFNITSDTKLTSLHVLYQGKARRERNVRMLPCTLWWKWNHVPVTRSCPILMETGQLAFYRKAKGILSEEDYGGKEPTKNVEKACASER